MNMHENAANLKTLLPFHIPFTSEISITFTTLEGPGNTNLGWLRVTEMMTSQENTRKADKNGINMDTSRNGRITREILMHFKWPSYHGCLWTWIPGPVSIGPRRTLRMYCADIASSAQAAKTGTPSAGSGRIICKWVTWFVNFHICSYLCQITVV